MAAFPDRWLDELFARTDLAALVSQYVPLTRKSGRLWGCCPFHNEKTPSFTVSPEKGMYYCFGCHAGGNAAHFVMQMEHLNFYDACRQLAEKANMELPERIDDERVKKERAVRDRLNAACREAAKYYYKKLTESAGKPARDYLSSRGLTPDVITSFGLGYSPDAWSALIEYLESLGFTKEELVNANLALSGKTGNTYDTFRNRVMFPIINKYQQVVAFGARTLGDDKPKYLNTGDTPVFNKRNNIYALNMQKGRHPADMLLVEGYMDVVGLWQYGVRNAVATLGTALTQQQARMLKQLSGDVYLCYDGDDAGQKATLRGIDILGAEGLNVKVITIPGGKDPDEYVRQFGSEAFSQLKQDALPVPGYRLKRLYGMYDLSNPDQRQECAANVCKYISTLTPIEQDRYVLEAAKATGFPAETLQRQISRTPMAGEKQTDMTYNYRYTKTEQSGVPENRLVKERLLLRILLDEPRAFERVEESAFELSAHKAAYRALKSHIGEQASIVLSELNEDEAGAAMAAFELPAVESPESSLEEALAAIKISGLEAQKAALLADPQAGAQTMKQIRELNLKIQELKRKGSSV